MHEGWGVCMSCGCTNGHDLYNPSERMHCRCKLQCRIAYQSNLRLKSQTACAPEALGWIQLLTRIPPGLGCWMKGSWLMHVLLFDILGVSWSGPGEVPILEASWNSEKCLLGFGGRSGAYGLLLEA